jgi:outer membrane lipoprotein
MKAKQWLASMVILSLIIGCTSVISENALQTVDKTVTYESVMANPDGHRGKVLLMGGTILETTPFKEKTVIMVLQHPLTGSNKPNIAAPSKGRCLVEVDGFSDPAVYGPGRQVTLVGTVMGRETRKLGQLDYTYPVIKGTEVYLWPLQDAVSNEPRFSIGVGIGTIFH